MRFGISLIVNRSFFQVSGFSKIYITSDINAKRNNFQARDAHTSTPSSSNHRSPPLHSTIIPPLLRTSISKHVQPLMCITVLPRILVSNLRAARNTAATLITGRCQLGRRDGAAAVVHLSCVEAHSWFLLVIFVLEKKKVVDETKMTFRRNENI